jgi:23S rRNA pseudouridine1911/1915/1917 synthase
MPHTWTTPSPVRLDVFLTQQLEGAYSRGQVQARIEAGEATVNGTPIVRPSHPLRAHDVVCLAADTPPPPPGDIPAHDLDLTVRYEDASCLVIDKPIGFAVHPGAGMPTGTLTILHGLRHLLEERGLHWHEGAVLVHRLDQDTTGCLLVAKDERSHRELQAQFAARQTEKHYLAIVAGQPQPASAIIDAPIGRHATSRTRMSVLSATRTRQAQTSYQTLDSVGRASLLDCQLHSGRTHQARVHLLAIGHPILGDDTYHTPASQTLSRTLQVPRVALHAWTLRFTSPATQTTHNVTCPPPADFRALADACGLRLPPS